MNSENGKASETTGRTLYVDEGGRRRPFLCGIMAHSQMLRGVGHREALQIALSVRRSFHDREVVTRQELREALRKCITEEPTSDVLAASAAPDSIVVLGKHGSRPFSKGILSQSLLAAAIDPNDAFEVARDIEHGLIKLGTQKIDRSELRNMSSSALERRMGKNAAQRYLTWRNAKRSNARPVIILLGGAAGTGKTALALEVAHRLGVRRVLSTDSIRQVMRIMLSPDLAPMLHRSSFDAYQSVSRSQRGDPVINGFLGQVSTVSVGVRAAIDRAIDENVSMIIDGVSLVPGLVDLQAYQNRADVFCFVVTVLDEKVLSTRFESRGANSMGRPAQRYLNNLEAIIKIQDYFLEVAEEYQVPIVDNRFYEQSVKLIIRHVTGQLGE